jgi:preprotein translocase subunit SecA
MKTGEGKTLVATLPIYLNALEGKGAHLVTVNDYLAKRDAQWMGQLYHALGLSTGVIQHDASFIYDPTYEASDKRLQHLRPCTRYEAYRADITYGTNNEYGFDYLRDNLVVTALDQCVQRELNFAIVDEVDSILIDEARTPLIISGPTDQSTDLYYRINAIIPQLKSEQDYTIEEKTKTASLTEEGNIRVEKLLGVDNLYDPANMDLVHHVVKALQAHALYKRDVDYVVKDGEVIIVDEFTGRLMPGRRWSDGLHQAVEAKENVKIERENQTLATVTFQNYFRMYKKLAGMTGTAETEAPEFYKTYKIEVTVIPTNMPMRRKEFQDVVYRTEEEKFRNAAKFIKELNEKGQPVLVGTISVEKSEKLSKILTRMGVKHEVLNAKNHAREAAIVAQAGRKSAVTVSTNMAGRGTDILLGGNAEFLARDRARKRGLDLDTLPAAERQHLLAELKAETDREHDEVVELGGLQIVATERHESRRIDNQLRGRAGRQGDPGASRFFLSLQDDLLRIFGGERMQNLMLRLGMEEDVPIESKLITRRIAAAQKAVEAQNFAARKHLLEYDDVMNKQRQAVYGMRRQLLEGKDQRERILEIIRGILQSFIDLRAPEGAHASTWDLEGLRTDVLSQFGVTVNTAAIADMTREEIEDAIYEQLAKRYEEKEQMLGPDGSNVMRETERIIMLNVVDNQWKDHLLSMDHLKEGIGLRGYAQKDPLVEYKKESFQLFQAMMDRIEDETIKFLYFMQAHEGGREEPGEGDEFAPEPLGFNGDGGGSNGATADHRAAQSALEDFTRSVHRKKDKELAQLQFAGGDSTSTGKQPVVKGAKVGRNDPCPCGSGKKYKKCCGA